MGKIKSKGFTLVEAIIATVLVSITLLGTSAIFYFGMNMWEKINDFANLERNAMIVFYKMQKEITMGNQFGWSWNQTTRMCSLGGSPPVSSNTVYIRRDPGTPHDYSDDYAVEFSVIPGPPPPRIKFNPDADPPNPPSEYQALTDDKVTILDYVSTPIFTRLGTQYNKIRVAFVLESMRALFYDIGTSSWQPARIQIDAIITLRNAPNVYPLATGSGIW